MLTVREDQCGVMSHIGSLEIFCRFYFVESRTNHDKRQIKISSVK